MGALRPQQWRLKWPLTSSQVEALDDMLQTLYKAVKNLTVNVQQITGILPIANGGTGADNAPDALSNLGGQPLDADLTALAALSSTGYLARTGAATYALRTFQAGSGISLSNADGAAGNTTITATGGSGGSQWSVLTNGDPVNPELIFAGGDVIMLETP